jgi:methanogenic corrinoid protein MtbC1
MSEPTMNKLMAAILEGECSEALSQVRQLREDGVSPEQIVIHGIEAAMVALEAKCTLEQFNLLELMLAGRAVTEVMKLLYPGGTAAVGTRGTIVLASLEGDVHDLGKNILKTILISKGYRVVDCGKDCPLQMLIEAIEKERPQAVGISGLITSIIPQVRQVKELLAVRGMDGIKVIAGGAALKQSSPTRLNVDFVADSAFDSLRFLNDMTGDAGGGQ